VTGTAFVYLCIGENKFYVPQSRNMQAGIWKEAPKVRERLKLIALNVEVNQNLN